MAEKSAKKKPKKPAGDASVLGNLPSTRPTRLGGERRTAAATATKAKPAAARAKPKSKAAATRKPKAKPRPAPTSAPPAGWQVPGGGDAHRDGIVTTAVQAAGELAQIGFTVGGQLLKRAAGRLPRP